MSWKRLPPFIEHHWDHLSEGQRDGVRVILILLMAGGIGSGVFFAGRPLWRHWQHRQALVQAKEFAEKNDYRSVLLALRRATELAPLDAGTWQQAVHYLSAIGSPEAVVAREQLARLAPEDAALRLSLVRDALAFGRLDSAATALARFPSGEQGSLAFHRLAAALAQAMGNLPELEEQLRQISVAAPGDFNARFNSAATRLWSADPAIKTAARETLEAFTAEPEFRVRAALALLTEAARQQDAGRVQQLLVLLVSRFAPKASPDFTSAGLPGWTALVDGLKAAASPSSADAALLARWLADMGRAPEALGWLNSLAPEVRVPGSAVADTQTELSAETDDLAQLDRLLAAGAWGESLVEGRMLALAARVQKLRFDEKRSRETWSDAVAASARSPAGLRSLARLATLWRDTAGAEQALQGLLKLDPRTAWAYEALSAIYIQRRDLPRLGQLYETWGRQWPDSVEVVATSAILGSILDKLTPELVEKVTLLQARAPVAVTVTFALAAVQWRQRQPAAAWATLSSLSEADRRLPTAVFWTGLILADLDRKAEAQVALAGAQRSELSEQERALLRMAARKIGYNLPLVP